LYLAQKLATCLLAKFVLLSEMMEVRELKATYDILLKEFDYLLSCDIRQWHHFYPLGEVVRSYQ